MLEICYLAQPSGCERLNKQGRYWMTSPVLTPHRSNLINDEPVSIVDWAPQNRVTVGIRYNGPDIIGIAGW